MSRAFRLALVLIGFAVFASCQSSSPVDSSNAPVDVTVPMKADSIHPLDSLQPFHTPTDSGLAVRGALAKGDVYNVAIHLSRPLNGGVLKFHYTSFGLRIFTASFTQEDRKPDLKLTGFDTTASEKLALKLLTDFDSARTRSPASHSRRTDPVSVQIQDLRAFYVGLLLEGDTTYAGFPATIPAGMDTVGLRGEVLVAAVGTGKTLTQLVTTWSLDLDSAKARIAIVALVVKGTIKDTSMVFPPSTVRLKQGVSVNPDPVVAGTRAKLAGAFSWNPGPLPSIVSTVLREGVAASKVRVLSSVSLAQSDTTLSMADGYLVEVDPTADTGAYVLSIQLANGGDVVRSEARFRVVAPDQRVDATPPSLSIQSPSKDTAVSNSTSSIVVVAIATDSAGIDSVKIGGYKLTATPYSASVDLAVGADTIVVQAWDKSGLRSTKTVIVTRGKSLVDTTKPVITRVGPLLDTVTVGYETRSYDFSWTVTDDSLYKVTMGKQTLDGTGSVYKTTVALNLGIDTFCLSAIDRQGNVSFDTVRITRQKDTTHPVAILQGSSKDTVIPSTTASIQVGWTVTDNALAVVSIGGVAAQLSGGVYMGTVALSSDSSWIRLVAIDSCSNSTRDSILVHRLFVPILSSTGGALAANQTANLTAVPSAPGDTVQISIGNGSWSTGSVFPIITGTTICSARSRRNGVISPVVFAVFLYPPTLSPVTGTAGADSVVVTSQTTGIDSIRFSQDTTKGWTPAPFVVRNGNPLYARSWLRGTPSLPAQAIYSVSHDTSVVWVKLQGKRHTFIGTVNGTNILFDSLPGLDTVVSVTYSLRSGNAHAKLNGGVVGSWKLLDSAGSATLQVINGSSTQNYLLKYSMRHSDSIVDIRDGQTYKVVRIGPQWWMAQNLNFSLGVDSSRCYANSADSCTKYGRIYQWHAAMGLADSCDTTSCSNQAKPQGVCPSGWHIPADADWTKLTDTVLNSSTAGTQLKSTSGWNSRGSIGNGTDDFGFRVLPMDDGNNVWFWTATEESSSEAWFRDVNYGLTMLWRNSFRKSHHYSLRCIRN
jgi:uncharacterized protein (TIGR02145 family)